MWGEASSACLQGPNRRTGMGAGTQRKPLRQGGEGGIQGAKERAPEGCKNARQEER